MLSKPYAPFCSQEGPDELVKIQLIAVSFNWFHCVLTEIVVRRFTKSVVLSMDSHSPKAFYTEKIATLESEKKLLLKHRNRLAWLRFLSVIAAFGAAWLFLNRSLVLTIASFLLLTSLFIYFLVKDLANRQAIEHTDRLILINQAEVLLQDHHFMHLPDGKQFADNSHPYTSDLDIFGRASLFQYINRTTAAQSASGLAELLKHPCSTEEIIPRQEAARELASKPEFRQQLQALGMAEPMTNETTGKINAWLADTDSFTTKTAWKAARIILPLCSFSILFLYVFGLMNAGNFTTAIILMMFVSYGISKKTNPAHIRLSRIAPQLSAMSGIVQLIEKSPFQSGYLRQIRSLFAGQQTAASDEIRSLTRILERFDYKLNFLIHIPLNTFLFWDLQQMFALDKWKTRNKEHVSDWFLGMAKMEVASSTGTLVFNHPHWVFPVLTSSAGVFDGNEIGHPLISPQKRITSSFSTRGVAQLNLITGSNMAGKSTFLRSIGINTVLAMAGCPVCATRLELSYMKVMSSMRISDNLEESTSTFYAELKKLKEIIEAVNKNEKVFLLLDEILRGTNSADRHTGSKALVKQLIHHNAVGVLATHDLELAKMADEYPHHIRNYHFDVQVANNELYFDYKLKEGVCQSMNASLLMKKIGIELD